MTDSKDPPAEETGPVQRYRFRVRTADGRELVSHIAAVRLPVAQALEPVPIQAAPAHAAAPSKAYVPVRILVSVQASRQGAFKPDKSGALLGHQFNAVELEFTLGSTRAAASSTGKHGHGLVRLVREIGPSTPQFRQALVTNEALTSVTFSCYGHEVPVGTAEVEFFTMKLTNARVASAELVMLNNKHPDLMKYAESEELKLAYQSIDWTWKDGATAQDEWR